MVLRWIEGFDASNNLTTMDRFYESIVGGTVAGSDDGMHYGDAARGNASVLTTPPLSGSVQDSWVIGFAFRPRNIVNVDAGGPEYPGVRLRNDDGEQIRLEMFTDNPTDAKPGGRYYRLRVMRGATELARTDRRFDIGSSSNEQGDDPWGWIYFEFKVTIDDTVGSFELRYHQRAGHVGQQTATWDSASSGLDTQAQATSGANRFELSFETGGGTTRRVLFDDIYVLDSTGTVNNDFLGRTAVVAQKLEDPAEGDTVEWDIVDASDLFEAWGEAQGEGNADSERATSKVTNQVELARVLALPVLRNASIFGVVHRVTAKMETTGSLTLHHRWRKTTGTPAESDGGNFSVSSTTFSGYRDIQELDPNTGVAWVVSDLDDYQHGLRNGG